jgi:hypothetical protein
MSIRYFKSLSVAAVVALSAGLTGVSQAHHSFAAEFDSKKPVAVDGVITKTRLVNPHSWLYVDVKNHDGSVTNWGFEFGTPISLRNKSVTKEDVSPGSKVHIEGYLAKNGGPFGYSTRVTLASGRMVQIGSAPDAPAPAGGR